MSEYDAMAILSSFSVIVFFAIFYIILKIKVDLEVIDKLRPSSDNAMRLKKDVTYKTLILILIMLLNLSLTGYNYYISNSISAALARIAFLHFLLNIIGIIFMVFFLGFKMFYFPFKEVGDLIAKK